jgi:hypothetical protein
MNNTLNLKNDADQELAQAKAEEVRLNRARLLSQRLESEIRPKTPEERAAVRVEAVRAARERNARNTNAKTAYKQFSGDQDEDTRVKDPSRISRVEDGSSEKNRLQSYASSGIAKKAVGVVGKINPEAGAGMAVISKTLSTVTNPLKAAKDKFGETTVYLMIGTAIFFDVFIAIIDLLDFVSFGLASLLLGSMFDMMAGMTFVLWFKIKGAKFGKRRTLSLMGGFIAKFIPLIDLLPDWTMAILLSFFQESLEAVASAVPGASSVTKGVSSSQKLAA